MKNWLSLLIVLLLGLNGLFGQDAYHQALSNQLQTDFGLTGGNYLLTDNETTNANAFWSYGTSTAEVVAVSGQDFSVANRLVIDAPGANPWDAGFGQATVNGINSGDRALLVVWLRVASGVTPNSSVNIYLENPVNFNKEAYAGVNLSSDWLQYFIPFESSQNYAAGALNLGLHLAFDAQEVQVGGFNVVNFGKRYALDQLPLELHNGLYGGAEPDAPWRAAAAARIDQHRKASLTVTVTDLGGNPLPGATVSVAMNRHLYGFGTAFKPEWVAGNSGQNNVYQDKILNLDGNGHGFNMLVNENSLKWRAWEQGWAGTPDESANAVAWARANNITFRGHNVLWPGTPYLPDDVVNAINAGNTAAVRTRVLDHIDEKLNYPGIKDSITDWDVLNEITLNEDIANAFQGEPGYPTGREFYTEIINKIRTEHPEIKQYINDYITIGAGSMNTGNYTKYKGFIQEQFDAGAGFDGVGFQSHIGSNPTSMYVVYDILEDFHQTFGMEAKITEYDLSDLVDPTTSANYLRDFMTMCFSHPSTNAFLMWGFWDGAHWLGHAPMFEEDWTLKPAGQAFIDLVFGEWWTDAAGATDGSGSTTIAGFKGDYTVTATYNGETVTATYQLTEDGNLTLAIDAGTGCTPGQACNDGDPCTTGETFDADCNCGGGTLVDADGDGICDSEDSCPSLDNALIGTPCDDGDNCTVNDVWGTDCGCAGTYVDGDNDGVCAADDPDDGDACVPDPDNGNCSGPCSEFYAEDFEVNLGSWNDGGSDCALISSTTYSNSGTRSVRLRDNSGRGSSTFTDAFDFSTATSVTLTGSALSSGFENGEDLILEVSTNGGSNFVFVQAWVAATDFQNGQRFSFTAEITAENLSTQTVVRLRADASDNGDAIYLDDLVLTLCDEPVSCTDGSPCDDGDPCTSGETYDADCNCGGGTFADADQDGVCDADDQCPGFDDNLIGTACNDGDDCTVNDVYGNDCQCTGTLVDNDGDGFCGAEDPDDADPCNPNPDASACGACTTVSQDDFEVSFGNWNDGGNDCDRITANPNSGAYSVRIRDNSGGTASTFSDPLALANTAGVDLSFSFYTSGMENGKSFVLEVSTNGGSSYAIHRRWTSGTDFSNNQRYQESLSVNGYAFTNNTVFRFRCDAANNGDQVFLDDILIEDCGTGALAEGSVSLAPGSSAIESRDWTVFPNPASGSVGIDLSGTGEEGFRVELLNGLGQPTAVAGRAVDGGGIRFQLEISQLPAGVYWLRAQARSGKLYLRKLIVE